MCAGACQRDVTQYFPALDGQTDDIEECILEFFEEHIQHKFPDPDCEHPLSSLPSMYICIAVLVFMQLVHFTFELSMTQCICNSASSTELWTYRFWTGTISISGANSVLLLRTYCSEPSMHAPHKAIMLLPLSLDVTIGLVGFLLLALLQAQPLASCCVVTTLGHTARSAVHLCWM